MRERKEGKRKNNYVNLYVSWMHMDHAYEIYVSYMGEIYESYIWYLCISYIHKIIKTVMLLVFLVYGKDICSKFIWTIFHP